MRGVRSLLPASLTALALAGCAGQPRAPTIVAAPPPVVVLAALPEGASPGMLVPQPLADGSFPTPNRSLSEPGAVWHLRAGLNVAALSCGGEQGAAIRAGYNRWLTGAKRPLAAAQARYAAEYGAAAAGRDAYDDAMTRLYNFFSQTPVRPAFCAAAASAVDQVAASDAAALPTLAAARLSDLDQPFLSFYRAYDAWRSARTRVVAAAPATSAAALTSTDARGRLTLDVAGLPIDTAVVARR